MTRSHSHYGTSLLAPGLLAASLLLFPAPEAQAQVLLPATAAIAHDGDDLEDYYEDLEDAREDYYEDLEDYYEDLREYEPHHRVFRPRFGGAWGAPLGYSYGWPGPGYGYGIPYRPYPAYRPALPPTIPPYGYGYGPGYGYGGYGFGPRGGLAIPFGYGGGGLYINW